MINATIANTIRKSNQSGHLITILDICSLAPSNSTVNTTLKMPMEGVLSQASSTIFSLSGITVNMLGFSSLVYTSSLEKRGKTCNVHVAAPWTLPVFLIFADALISPDKRKLGTLRSLISPCLIVLPVISV